MDLASKVKQRRLELGMSQEELAKKMGYSSRTSINKIEKGRAVSQKIICRLANALDTTPAYLMGWEDEKKEEKHFLSIDDGKEVLTQEEQAIKCLLNVCGFDLMKSNGEYHLFGKYSQISAIEKEDVDNLINKAVEVLDLVATKLDYECHEKFIKALNELEKHG